MRSLLLEVVLLDYDYPQVFVGGDKVGQSYACMVAEVNDYRPRYLCVPISAQRRKSLCSAGIDLFDVFSVPEIFEFYWLSPDTFEVPAEMERAAFSFCPDMYLPKKGLIFEMEDEVAAKALEVRSTVAYASLSVPEAVSEARIHSRVLAEFLGLYQNALKNLSRFTSKLNGKSIPRDSEPYSTDVFGFSQGSFTIHLRSSEASDCLGENAALSMAFAGLNKFLDSTSDPMKSIEFLQGCKGHTASALIRLLRFLSENNCPLKHQWASPGMSQSSRSAAGLENVRRVIDLCRQREDLGVEEVVLRGVVDSADRTRGTWKVISTEESYSGELHPLSDVDLSGVVIGNSYILTCEERVEGVLGTGKEIKKLLLVKLQPLAQEAAPHTLL
jgi:hypothetical protein